MQAATDWTLHPWHHNNVGGVTAGQTRHNSSNVGGVSASQVGHNSSILSLCMSTHTHQLLSERTTERYKTTKVADDEVYRIAAVMVRAKILFSIYKC